MQINFGNVNKKILAMAQDFPESKYDYRPAPDVRSFAEVILHDQRLAKSPAPWPSYIEHAGEHYGQLVVYYRVNGLVPPASRPKDKTD